MVSYCKAVLHGNEPVDPNEDSIWFVTAPDQSAAGTHQTPSNKNIPWFIHVVY